MLHDDYLCLVESGKQQIKTVRRKFNLKTWKQRQLLSESGFVLRIVPPSLSRDGRIKMKKSISISSYLGCYTIKCSRISWIEPAFVGVKKSADKIPQPRPTDLVCPKAPQTNPLICSCRRVSAFLRLIFLVI